MNGNCCRRAEEVNDSSCLSPLVPEFSSWITTASQHEAFRQTKIREKEHHQPFQMTSDIYTWWFLSCFVNYLVCSYRQLHEVIILIVNATYLYNPFYSNF